MGFIVRVLFVALIMEYCIDRVILGGVINHILRLLLWVLVFCFIGEAISAEESPIVVVHPATQPEAFISQSALRAIFGMRLKKWEDGSPIRVFVMPDAHPLHIAFSKYILHVFPYQLRSAWDRLVFSGTGESPIIVNSEQKMRMMVSSTPGAIGYLSRSMIDNSVKIIPGN